jgi:hypothetical protein
MIISVRISGPDRAFGVFFFVRPGFPAVLREVRIEMPSRRHLTAALALSLAAPLSLQATAADSLSDRSLSVGIEVDRYEARLIAYTVKNHPFFQPLESKEPVPYSMGLPLQMEIVLHGGSGPPFTRRVEVGPLCVSHGPGAPPHVQGDTILLHRDSFIVELPEVAGMDTIELAYYQNDRGTAVRNSLGFETLDRARFTPAGSLERYRDLAFAESLADTVATRDTTGDVLWPEQFSDPDIFRIYGNPAEGDRRINIVIVPDGYSYVNKPVMEAHADALVQYFRQKTPYAEHDSFVNYTLVYAYSRRDGTDQCDCDIIVDTAMGTRFPDAGDTCGGSGNRCLYYGGGCDTDSTTNIVAAELRAPHHDETIVMVNTPRYGGCGGARAVYSAGAGSATEIAVHELGHSLAGLADEYGGDPGCGSWAGEINTSLNPTKGAWQEWVAELGAPREGAQYYNQCIYRPQDNCDMRSLNQPFCAVCNQHWSLVFFGHSRVSPTAPLESISPSSPASAWVGVPVEFTITTRFAAGPNVTNDVEWSVQGPSDPEPVPVATGVTSYSHTFTEAGQHTLRCTVTADTNFIKPFRYGSNVDEAVWTVEASDLPVPPEVSPPGSPEALIMTDKETALWEDASPSGALYYNLYRGSVDSLPAGEYGSCDQPAIPVNGTTITGYPPQSTCWFYLVTGGNPTGEGPLGLDSNGGARTNGAPCE